MGKTTDLSAFERDMVIGARHARLSRTATLLGFSCQELQRCWVFHAQQFPVCINNGPPPKGHPANLTQMWEAIKSTWASIPVGSFRHLIVHAPV